MSRFDANTFPLGPGIRMLEASAGTGKTFALAHLVLRLVADAGVPLRELLVVTFTEAAVAELRDRIARRLQQALTQLEAAALAEQQAQAEAEDGIAGLESSAHQEIARIAARDSRLDADQADPNADGTAAAGPEAGSGAAAVPAGDQVLQSWLEQALEQGAGERLSLLRGRLLLALEELDGTDITTIHGFCSRTLQRQALEAGRPAELRIEAQGDGLVAQVVHDYWQQQVLDLPLPLLAGLQAARVQPELLESLLTTLDGDPALDLDPLPPELPADQPLPECLPALVEGRWRSFVREWQGRGEALEAEFREAAATWRQLHGGSIRTGDYSTSPNKDRVALLSHWIAAQPAGGDYEAVLAQTLLKDYVHPASYLKQARRFKAKGASQKLPQAPLLEAAAALREGPAELVLLHACHWGRAELARRRERRGVTTFSGLLEQLDPGTDEARPSPLLEAVAGRYRAVLVDEFQDTDPIQWRILRRAFGRGEHALVLVGDPKQAIYRFRGGDLDTYRRARGEASIEEMLENHRSTEDLVKACNALMEPGLPRSGLDLPAVQARARRSGPPGPPIDLLWLPPQDPAADRPGSRTDLEARLPAWIALSLERLLAEGLTLSEGNGERALEPGDCCLLVSNHRQAEQLRQALERRGIASRLVSRADVFDTPGATALQRFLDALADPADLNRLRLLAASPLQGWSAATIAATGSAGWSALAGRLDDLASQLHRRGLLGVLADWIAADTLAALAWGGRLLADLQQVAELVQERIHAEQLEAAAAADWLRRLRLAEDRVVPEEHQAHSDRRDDAVAVVTIHRSKGLEFPLVICPYLWQAASGRQRIGRRWQPPGNARPVLDLHLSSGWGASLQASEHDRLAEAEERERLAYVAITRACHRLVLAWGPAADQQSAPLFPWLFPDQGLPGLDVDPLVERPPAEWRELLEASIARRCLPIRLLDPPEDAPAPSRRPSPPAQPLATGPVPGRRLDSRWGRSSYSSWTQASHEGLAPAALDQGRDTADPAPSDMAASEIDARGREAPDTEASDTDASDTAARDVDAPHSESRQPESRETGSRKADAAASAPAARLPSAPTAAADWPDEGPLANFPRGAAAGECLHRILERLELSAPIEGEMPEALISRELRRAGLPEGVAPQLQEGLERMRTTPLGGALGGLRVADLPAGRRLHELNFDLTLSAPTAAGLARAFGDHPGGLFGADYAASLAQLPIDSRGFLTGSIDLVFRADPTPEGGDGRWWVLDWKSNWLGRRDGEGRPLACGPRHYGEASMAALMAASHYPLQAHLYLVALHRYLGWRLSGYQPQRDLGGYAYVFLRGTPGPEATRWLPGPVPGMLVERPPLERILALDAALGRDQAASAAAGGNPRSRR